MTTPRWITMFILGTTAAVTLVAVGPGGVALGASRNNGRDGADGASVSGGCGPGGRGCSNGQGGQQGRSGDDGGVNRDDARPSLRSIGERNGQRRGLAEAERQRIRDIFGEFAEEFAEGE